MSSGQHAASPEDALTDSASFKPLTELEEIIARVSSGKYVGDPLRDALLDGSLIVLADRPMPPGVWEKDATALIVNYADKGDMVAAFTHESRMEGWAETFPTHLHPQTVSVQWLLDSIVPQTGLGINLTLPVSVQMPPALLNQLREALKRRTP
jgi:hypothetical protein